MLLLFGQMTRLIRLCIGGPGGKAGIALYAIVLALELADILVTLRLIAWTKAFYDALQQLDASEALRQVGIFGLIVLTTVTLNLTAAYLRKLLEIRWRKALTAQVTDRWLGGRAYLRTGATADGGILDNPDQRIAEDCRIFLAGPATDHGSATGIIPLSLDLITRTVGLFSYVAVLWGLSTFPLELGFLGIDGEIPRYMVWAAFLYVALSTGITHLLGRPLKQLYVNQQRREADYRFALVRVRENADPIALSGGEAAERREIDGRFGGIVTNWKRLINRELILSCFTYPYRSTVLRVPVFLALPGLFAGHVTFGGLMQVGNAFSQVVTTLSWFIFAYRPLAELAAATARLAHFVEALERDGPQGGIARTSDGAANHLAASAIRLFTPQGRPLASVPDLTIARGEAVWLRGASGIGKTTLLKALAGVWPHGSGRVCAPAGRFLMLPQQPYMPIGGVAEAAAYPLHPTQVDAGQMATALEQVGLGAGRLDTAGEQALTGLSGGERQRLALARILVHRPDWVVLDEATSALDRESEAAILETLRAALPEATFIVVSHRRPTGLGHMRTIELDGMEEGKREAA